MSKAAKDKAEDEPRILQFLQHRNLVKFDDFFVAQDSNAEELCLVTELIEGDTLEYLI